MEWIKKHAQLIAVCSVMVVLAAAGTGVMFWIENQNNQVPDRSITNPQKTMEQTSEETDDPGSETENGSETITNPGKNGTERTSLDESDSSAMTESSEENTEETQSTEEDTASDKTEENSSEEQTKETETKEEDTSEEITEEPTESQTEEPTKAPDPREQVLNHYQNLGVVNDVNNYLNVRDNPNLDATVIGKVLKFGGVNILEATPDGWLKIAFPYVDCGYGYVYGEFVSQGEDAIALAVANSMQMISVTAEVLNVREQPNTDCKILTQIITGEHYQVVQIENGWVEITLGTNDSTGEDILAYVSEDFVELGYYLSEPIEYVPEVTINPLRTAIVEDAIQYLGGRYQWGGETLGVAVDCSGFTRAIFANHGIYLPRVSYDQAEYPGVILTDASQLKPGDLLFYSRPGLTIGHVGIYIGNGQVIHAYNEARGIIITPYNYATPMRMLNVIGE